jgi:hypothetical protein
MCVLALLVCIILGVRSDKNRRILKVFARKFSQFGHVRTLLLIEPRKKNGMRDALSQLVHEIGRYNLAYHLFV